MKFFNTILDLIFPASCLSCNKKGSDLCSVCLANCPATLRECPSWIFPLYDYQYLPIKKAIHFLKYKKRIKIAPILAKILYFRILEELSDLSRLENFYEPILIPVPLAPKRIRERGFNQSLLICQELEKLDTGKNFKLEKGILIKPKDTEHQVNIDNRNKRLKNIVGCFIIKNNSKIKNKNIILIDDVVTTGATLSEAKKVLKEAGARKVIAFTIAH